MKSVLSEILIFLYIFYIEILFYTELESEPILRYLFVMQPILFLSTIQIQIKFTKYLFSLISN